jgi:hypothetical protein
LRNVNDPVFKDFSHMAGTDIREKEKIWAQMQKLDYLPYSEKFGGFYIVSKEFAKFEVDSSQPIRWIGGETNGMENLPLLLTPRK